MRHFCPGYRVSKWKCPELYCAPVNYIVCHNPRKLYENDIGGSCAGMDWDGIHQIRNLCKPENPQTVEYIRKSHKYPTKLWKLRARATRIY